MPAPATPLIDPFGRRVTDLRLSITDRCNLRCTYCMPAEGMQWLPRADLLTYEEQAQIVRVCVERFGFESVRITGGEPLVRAHITRLIQLLAPLGIDISMTTNGVKLAEVAHDLAAAGLRRINVSLDSLTPSAFAELTRRDDLPRVLQGIDAALDAGLDPVKVNCVVMRGVNDHEVVELAAYGRDRGVGVRFIEFMPLDASGKWSYDLVVPASEILEQIHAVFPFADPPVHGASTHAPGSLEGGAGHVAPAERFRFADGIGDVGVIASVTAPFCEQCDRIRVTSEGQLRTCLFALDEFDLRAILRGAAVEVDDLLAAEIERAVGTKWAGHRIGKVDFVRPDRSMSQIGG
ncbi:MAG: GTP 3',8-cyclase MoaA [Acidimicrobiia bacterium]